MSEAVFIEGYNLKDAPVFARVFIERPLVDKTAGGIIIPDSSQKTLTRTRGKIIATGPAADDSIKDSVGLYCTFGKFAGAWDKASDADGNEREIYVVQDEDIIAVERRPA